MNIEVNYLAVILATIASMMVGFAWYSPMLFGKSWMKLMGYTSENMKKNQKEMGKWYMLSMLAALVMAYVLSHVMGLSKNFYNYDGLSTGLISAFWMWLGFVAPVQLTDVIFGKRIWRLFFINTGYQLTSMLLMGMILGLM